MIPIAIDVSLVILVGLLTIRISFLDSPSKANSPFRFVSLILRCVSIICIMFIGIRNYQTQTESMQSKEKLETSLADIASVQDLNTELQKQLVKSNAALAELAKTNIDEVTGGDSFCYVEIRQMALTTGLLQAFVLGKGKNPLSDLRIRWHRLNRKDLKYKSERDEPYSPYRSVVGLCSIQLSTGRLISHKFIKA